MIITFIEPEIIKHFDVFERKHNNIAKVNELKHDFVKCVDLKRSLDGIKMKVHHNAHID